MHVILFPPSLVNCGCYGNGNSQIVGKTWIPRGGKVLIMHIFFSPSHKYCFCYGTEIVKMLQW